MTTSDGAREAHQAACVDVAAVGMLTHHRSIAGQFALRDHPADREIHTGMEPEQRAGDARESTPKGIAALHVLQLVPEDRFQLLRVLRLARRRHQDPWA